MKKYLRIILGLVGMLLMAVMLGAFNAETGDGVMMATPLLLAGFTDEQSKSFSDFMGKQATDMQDKVKGLIAAAKDGELLNELKTMLKGDGDKAKGIADLVPLMQKQLDAVDLKLQKAAKTPVGEEGFKSLEEGIMDLIKSDEFKNAKKEGFGKKSVFELKVDSSVVTGDVNRTLQNMTLDFANKRMLAFTPFINQATIGQDKNRVLWMDGAYTSNVGYVGEGVAAATADAGTATEKGREMAKIAAKLPLTAEMLEDFNYIASQFRLELRENSMLFEDQEVYTGDGSDGGNPKHIYGIVGHATTFNATTAGVTGANGVELPNIGDAIDTGILQARKSHYNGTNILWINPSDFFALKKTKGTDGQYLFVKDVNGTYSISGLRVVESEAVTANTMTLADTSRIVKWNKRRPEVKFGQMNGTDMADDSYLAVLFIRSQVVVKTHDKLSIIHFPDVAAAITAITKV